MRIAATVICLAALASIAACTSEPEVAVPQSTTPPTSVPAEDPSTSPTSADETATTGSSTTGAPATTDAPATSTTDALPPMSALAYETVATGIPTPIFAASPIGDDRLYIAHKNGTITIHDDGTTLLDISGRVRNSGEQGLLGLAFATDFAHTGRYWVHYTADDGDTVLSEFTTDGDTTDPSGEIQVFRTAQPASNHNGGMIAIGPDGHLYLGLGDGGGANDRFGHGQRSDTVLGTLLRFDVSTPGVAVPAEGNPFEAEEVFAYGLRNPWRFAFDPSTADLYIADVGQGLFEEVSVAPRNAVGVNYGWPITEGLHCFSPREGCSTVGLTLPVLEVDHGDAGTCSITGGFVYRGAAIPEIHGHYFYSDYCGGYLRSIRVDGGVVTETVDWTDDVGVAGQVVSFGLDTDGEILVLTATGDVLRIVAVRG